MDKGFVEVELTDDWLGHPAGSVLQMRDFFAKALIGRGGAKMVEPESESATRQKVNEPEEENPSTHTVRVRMQRRVQDKMVKSATVDK